MMVGVGAVVIEGGARVLLVELLLGAQVCQEVSARVLGVWPRGECRHVIG
jgi:hypothetical protein